MNEESVGDSADADSWWKERSTSKRGKIAKSYAAGVYDQNRSLEKHGYEDMSEILKYVWIGGIEWKRVELDSQV